MITNAGTAAYSNSAAFDLAGAAQKATNALGGLSAWSPISAFVAADSYGAGAQAWHSTNADNATGWANSNALWLVAQAYLSNQQAEIVILQGDYGTIPDAQTNSVLNSFKTPLWTTNIVNLTDTNWFLFPITVTNFAGCTFISPGGSPFFYFEYSTNNGSTWIMDSGSSMVLGTVNLAFTNNLGSHTGPGITNSPVSISSVVVYTLTRPDLFARSNSTVGQEIQVGYPNNPDDATPLSYVQGLVSAQQWYVPGTPLSLNGAPFNVSSAWTLAQDATNNSQIDWNYNGSFGASLSSSSFQYASIHSISLKTNYVTLTVLTNLVTSAVIPQFSTPLSIYSWANVPRVTSSYPYSTSGLYTISFPEPATNAAYIRTVFFTSGNIVFGVNGSFYQPPQTITASTNSTTGYGAGLMNWDTNYIYVSVGTNRWKRAALSTW
jgi:hypothetical protein